MPPPKVKREQLERVQATQRALAYSRVCWSITLADACKELHNFHVVTGLTMIRLQNSSIALLTDIRRYEDEHRILVDTLKHCCGRYDNQSGLIIEDTTMIVRAKGGDDYPIEYVMIPTHMIVMYKDAERRVLYANSNFFTLSNMPTEAAIGKTSDEIWPGAPGMIIRANELEVTTNGPMIYRETLRVDGRSVDRLSFRFILPECLKPAEMAVICFNADALQEMTIPAWAPQLGSESQMNQSQEQQKRLKREANRALTGSREDDGVSAL